MRRPLGWLVKVGTLRHQSTYFYANSRSNSEHERAKVLIEKSPLTNPLCQRGAGGISFARDLGPRVTRLNANLY